MKEIIEDNYDSIVKRGLINKKTSTDDFVDKLFEEVREVENLCLFKSEISEHMAFEYINQKNLSFELADVILTALNFAKHYDIDIEHFLKEKIKLNYEKAKIQSS